MGLKLSHLVLDRAIFGPFGEFDGHGGAQVGKRWQRAGLVDIDKVKLNVTILHVLRPSIPIRLGSVAGPSL